MEDGHKCTCVSNCNDIKAHSRETSAVLYIKKFGKEIVYNGQKKG